MRYFIIAGEQSGDLHGSNLVKELILQDHNAEIACWGGDLMEKAGARLLMHYRKTAFMGFMIILKNLRTIFRNLKLCKQQILDFKPDVILLIDYAGFNLRIAEFGNRHGFKVFYYISPKFWAWNEGRVKKVQKYVDRMFIIFPFEEAFYKKWNVPVKYVGNPLFDEIERDMAVMPSKDKIREELHLGEKPVIALLAGSRKHEIKSVLPEMIKMVDEYPDYQFVLAGVKNIQDDIYYGIIGDAPVRLIKEKTYEILSIAEAALVTSGTATLETAIINIPQVVCYSSDFFSLVIAWMLMKVKYVSLVNLIAEYEVVKELLGYNLNKKNLSLELGKILKGGMRREKIFDGYALIRQRLGHSGASKTIAGEVIRETGLCGQGKS